MQGVRCGVAHSGGVGLGRRVRQQDDAPAAALRACLHAGRPETARLLAPEAEMGRVIWPVG